MCGLTALISTDVLDSASVERLRTSMRCQRHRGPDDTEIWADDEVCFGFNRLSIIDIEHSSQPLQWGPEESTDRYVMVFNGEIYNYVELRQRLIDECGAIFRTQGDGEVIVVGYHYFGEEWVNELRGMFAFVIWDREKKVAFGARDPFGIKPLYYAQVDEGYLFSSEAKSIRSFTEKAEVNQVAFQHYMVLQYVPEPYSADAQCARVESGTSFTFSGGDMKMHRYFEPRFTPAELVTDYEKERLYQRIADVLDESVAHHMRADVTVGSFLSGGIDSTAIAALAKRYNDNLLTFTTGFEREGYSEVDVAAASAEAIGVKHIVKIVSEEELCDTLPLIVWYLDDPVADPALVPLYFVAQEARKHVKVVLSGEGADELFGGYNIYREPLSLAPLTRLPHPVRRVFGALSSALPAGMRGKDMLRRASIDMEQRYYGNARIFREDQLNHIMKAFSERISYTDVTAPIYERSRGWDPVARMQHIDLFTWLRGDILVKADKMTMANSLELRVPFLDKEVFEVARTVPLDQKITKDQSKLALRKAMEKIVPSHVINRRKLGFPVPIRVYMKGGYGYEWARSIIASAHTDYLIDTQAALALLDDHRAGKADHSRRIWTLLVFMLWHDIFIAKTITPPIPEPTYPVKL